ncbi:co-chaperone protein Sba1p [Diutina catenulata]
MAVDPETTKTLHPIVKWAQRSNADDAAKNIVYLTVEVSDPKNLEIDLTETSLKFAADASDDSGIKWRFSLEFYEAIDTKESKYNTKVGSHILFVLRKAKAQEEYWPRLTKDKLKHPSLKTDFDRWVDEDEQDEHADDEDDMAGMGGMGGMPGMGGMGGAGGPGGMDFSSMLGGAGGAGGAGGMDFAKLMQQMGGAGGAGGDEDFDISDIAEKIGNAGDKEGEEAEEIEEIKKD